MNNVDYLSAAVEIAREAGQLLQHHYERRVAFEYKQEFDLVTVADRASEKLIVERLHNRFPSHAVIAEEGGGRENGSEHVWHVDPLDGTTNFAHSFPVFAVSLGLVRRGEPVAAVVHDPIREETFTAEKGGGAYLNHHRIEVSQISSLGEGLYATGFASPRRHTNVNVHFFHQVSMLSHGMRRAGSAALDLCSVACGRLEGFWEFGLKTWDVAAGLLIASEAGGRYSDMKGGSYELGGTHLAVSNGLIHDDFIALFRDIFEGRYRVPMPPLLPEIPAS